MSHYNHVVEKNAAGGMCPCGGADEPLIGQYANYEGSAQASAKQQASSDTVSALAKLFKVEESGDMDKTIDQIMEKIPNPKNGKAFKQGEEQHKKLCASVALALNKQIGETIFDESAPADIICKQLAEYVNSIRQGVHGEFMQVRGNVKEALKNLMFLRNQVEEVFAPLIKVLEDSKESKTREAAAKYGELHSMVVKEMSRQIEMLSNLLDITITPAQITLESILKDNGAGKIEPLKYKVGSPQFGEYIAMILNNAVTTPIAAMVVDKALKKVGVSVREYLAMADLKALREKVATILLDKDLSDEKLKEVVKSWDILYKNFSHRNDIAKTLAEVEHKMSTSGSFEKSALDRRVKAEKKARKLVLEVFNRQVMAQFYSITSAIESLANKVGKEIPTSDQLDGFVEALGKVGREVLENKYAYASIIGYFNDARSREMREQFVAQLKMLQGYIDSIVEMSIYKSVAHLFKDLQSHIKNMIDLIDKVSAQVVSKFGGESPAEGEDAEACAILTAEHKTTGGVDEYSPGAKHGLPASVTNRTAVDLKRSIQKMRYYYNVSKVQSNLANVSKELPYYAEGYEDLRAKMIGRQINECMDLEKKMLEDLKDKDKTPFAESHKDLKTATEHFIKRQTKSKVEFWKTVEAIDEYMRIFTDGIANDPSAIHDLRAQLDQSEVISKWYNDATGNAICKLFDQFPAYVDPTNQDRIKTNAAIREGEPANTQDHYYKRLGALWTAHASVQAGQADLPGNPFICRDPSDDLCRQAKSIIESLQNIKNLLSMFIYIGYKFAGKEIHKKVFMTPTQIYRNLCDYLVCSAFGMGMDRQCVEIQGVPIGGQLELMSKGSPGFAKLDIKDFISIVRDMLRPGLVISLERVLEVVDAKRKVDRAAGTNYERVLRGVGNDVSKHITRYMHLANMVDDAKEAVKVLQSKEKDFSVAKAPENGLLTGVSTALQTYRNAFYPAANGPVPNNGINDVTYAQHVADMDTVFTAIKDFAKTSKVKINLIYGGAKTGGVFDGATNNKTYTFDAAGNIVHDSVIHVGASTDIIDTTSTEDFNKVEFYRKFGVYMRGVIPYLQGDSTMQEADKHLICCLKSIAAKVMTVVGLQDVLNRPDEVQVFTPIRMILGAADELPKIEPNAVELYYRLPLLGQFYRDLFGFTKDPPPPGESFVPDENVGQKITMLPEAEGIFGGFIKLLFRRRATVNLDDFADADLQEMIREINVIYEREHAKHGDGVVNGTVTDFVNEINRRYGLIRRKDRDTYRKMFSTAHKYDEYLSNTDIVPQNIAILPGEMDQEFEGKAVAPSSRYVKGSALKLPKLDNDYDLAADQMKLLYRFRCRLDDFFRTNNAPGIHPNPLRIQADDRTYSFKLAIKAAVNQMKAAPSNADRYKILSRLVRGYGVYGRADIMKYVMLHETVIAGLNTLSAIYSLLAGYKHTVQAAYALYQGKNLNQALAEYFKTGSPPVAGDGTYNIYATIIGPGNRIAAASEVLESILYVVADLGGLVELHVTDDRLRINWSNLRECIDDTFRNVRQFLDVLRPHFTLDEINTYISKTQTGSYYWLQENLVDKILVGREKMTDDPDDPKPYHNLEKLNGFLPDIFRGQDLTAALDDYTNTYGGNATPAPSAEFSGVTVLINQSFGNKWKVMPQFAARTTHAFDYGSGVWVQHGDLVSQFNQLLAKYLEAFFDAGINKIYTNLISAIINGPLNNVVMNPLTGINDVTTVAGGVLVDAAAVEGISATMPIRYTIPGGSVLRVVPAHDPSVEKVLYASIANMLRNAILSRNNTNNASIYLSENLTEIPIYMREKYRGYLPIFRTMFEELIKRSEVLRELLNAKGAADLITDNEKPHHVKVCDAVAKASASVIAAIDQVMREVADSPKHLELSSSFIVDYKNANGKEPVMPLSGLLESCNNTIYNQLRPIYSYGSDEFKLAYGLRLTLASPKMQIGIDQIPGFKNNVDNYNMLTDSRSQIDKDLADKFAKGMVKLNRYIVEASLYKQLDPLDFIANPLAPVRSNNVIKAIVPDAALAGTAFAGGMCRIVYELQPRVNLVALVENARPESALETLVEQLTMGAVRNNASKVTANIIDLNIIPINVHALMRDIPLVNIYNYSYTFDRMLIDLIYGVNSDVANKLLDELCADPLERTSLLRDDVAGVDFGRRQAKEILASLTIDPYRDIKRFSEVTTFLKGLNASCEDVDLGRAKFVTDQLIGKALMQYPVDTRTILALPANSDLVYISNKSKNGKVGDDDYDDRESLQQGQNNLVVVPTVPANAGISFQNIGILRLQTVFARDLIFISNLYRVLNLKMRKDLFYSHDPILRSHAAIRESNTEFRRRQTTNNK
jgi:hypothetical protein